MKFNTVYDINKMAKRKLIPLHAYLELTFRCNLKCVHCFTNIPHCGKELSFKEVVLVLDQLAEAGTLFVDFSGGEPLIRKDFIDIAKYARKLDFAITIVSNATLITEDLADKITELFPRRVKLTLYGADEEMYNRITGKPSLFRSAIKGIRILAERRLPVIVASPIFNFYTVKDLLAMKKICDSLGVRWWCPSQFFIKIDGDPEPLKYRLSESQFESFSKKIPTLHEFPVRHRLPRIDKNSRVCENLRCNIYINPFGQIGNCNMLVSKGSIRERPLLDIWKNNPLLQAQRALTWKNLLDCIKCKSFFYCKPCPATNFLSTGSFTEVPAFFCQYAHMVRSVNESLCPKIY